MNTSTCNDIMMVPVRAAKAGWYGDWVDWYVGARSHRVACFLLGMLIINAFDVTLTLAAHSQGMLEESNPIARAILGRNPYAIVPFKLALVLFPTVVLYRYRDRWLAELAAGGVMFVYVLVAFQWHLCYELYAVAASGGASMQDVDSVCLGNVVSRFVF